MDTSKWPRAQASRADRHLPDHLESALNDLDPKTHPIIAAHFFGIATERPPTSANANEALGFRHIGPVAAEIVADVRFRHHVERLHRLGPRVTGELLAEIAAERGIRTIIDVKLARYAALDPEVTAAIGGSYFWPVPLTAVRP